MSLLNNLFKGAIVLSILALAQHGFTVKAMAKEPAKEVLLLRLCNGIKRKQKGKFQKSWMMK